MLLFLVSRWQHTGALLSPSPSPAKLFLYHIKNIQPIMKHFTVITFYHSHIFSIARIKIEFINAIKITFTIIMDFFLNSNFS